MRDDLGLKTLLDLNDSIIDQDNGYWIKYAGRRLPFDHKHRHVSDKGVPYGFESAYQLLEDFFKDVDRVLQEIKQS